MKFIGFLILIFLSGSIGRAQIPLSAGSYVQNFNALSSTSNLPWTDNVTLPGWYAAHQQGSDSPHYSSYRVSNGSLENGWIYSFGTTGSTDRALGSVCTATPQIIAYGVCFTNDTKNTLDNFTVTYTGEQWRNAPSEASQKLAFSYRVSATPVTSPEPGVETDWKVFPKLDFISPHVGLGMFAMDGKAAENRAVFSRITLTGVVLKPGEELFLRWVDVNDPSLDDGLAIDDFKLEFSPAP